MLKKINHMISCLGLQLKFIILRNEMCKEHTVPIEIGFQLLFFLPRVHFAFITKENAYCSLRRAYNSCERHL